jgi:uncharacterized integral membrane protein
MVSWPFLILCISVAVIIGYLIYAIVNRNKKAEYYKKLDKWRKNRNASL